MYLLNLVCEFLLTAEVWVWFSITTSDNTGLSGRVGMIFKQECDLLINRYGMLFHIKRQIIKS